MPINTVVLFVESTSALVVFALLVFWLIPNYRLDLFRQEVFAVRDELFDYARAGNISFADPAYRLLRQSFNGFIRYAHRLTFYKVVMTMIVWKVVGREPELVWTRRWTDAIASLDEKTRADLLKFHERLVFLIVRRLVFGSPALLMALSLTAIVMLCKAGVLSIKAAFKKSAEDTVSHVIDPRLLEEDAVDTSKAAFAS
jgi:hypothetical protein